MSIENKNIKTTQEDFINSTKQRVLVSASAGSGKTTTMIRKLTHLVLNENVSLKNLLVLTFTDAAANEMKQRLYTSLTNEAGKITTLIETETEKTKKEELIKKQEEIYNHIENLNFCDIGTFHSIFKRFIAKYFYMLDIDPSFSILNDQEQSIILNQSISNVFERYILSGDSEFFLLQEMFNKKRKDTAFKEQLIKLYNTSIEKINFEEWFNESIEKNYNTNLDQNQAVQYLILHYKNSISSYLPKLNKLIEISDLNVWTVASDVLKTYITIIQNIQNTTTFSEFLVAVFSVEGYPRLTFPKNTNIEFEFAKEEIKKLHDDFKEFLNDTKKELVTPNISTHLEMFEKTKRSLLKLIEIVKEIKNEFTKQKQSQSVLDFGDLQTYAHMLVQNSQVAHELSEQYEYIFLDEFQDVNEIQFEIISKIAKQHLNLIGDVKQSIYEFRLATPDIFLQQLDELSVVENGEIINLNKNYRSSNAVLDFSNYLFNALITKQTVGIDYKGTSQLVVGNDHHIKYDEQLKNNGVVQVSLTIIDKESQNDKEETAEEPESEDFVEANESGEVELTANQLEAEAVVSKINELIGKPFVNSKNGEIQYVNYKDIAILTRDSGEFAKVLQDTLEKYKIPFYSTSKNNIFKTYEVGVLFNFLKLLNNPNNDYALVSVLVSPFGEFSYNELAQIRLLNNSKIVPFYECCNLLLNEEFEDEKILEIKHKLHYFYNMLSHYRSMLNIYSIYEVLVKAINDHNLMNYFKSMPDGNLKISNITEWLKLTNSQTYKFDLVQLVEYLEELSYKDGFKVTESSGENAVTILTMHKSKGLEYPVVILANLGKRFKKSSTSSDLIISQHLGVGIKYKDPENRYEKSTLQLLASSKYLQTTEIKEQIRLLYVATTRAKNYLYLVGSEKVEKLYNNHSKDVLQSESFLELITKSFNESEINKLQNKVENFNINANAPGECKVQILTGINSSVEIKKEITPNDLTNELPHITQKLLQNFDFIYEKQESIPVKNSVTGLLVDQDYVKENYAPKTLRIDEFEEHRSISLLKGVAYHKIMQQLDYKGKDQISEFEVKEIIDAFVKNGEIEPQIANLINTKLIVNGFNAVKQFILDNTNIQKEKVFLLSDEYKNLVDNSNISQKVIVQGVVDLILINGNNAVVIDFKTNQNTNENYLKQTYSLQLNLYAKAVMSAYGVSDVEKYLYIFESDKLIKV